MTSRLAILLMSLFVPWPCQSAVDFFPPGYSPVGSVSQTLVATDLNEDGRPDLAVLNWQSADISILLANGQGGFASSTVPTGPNAVALSHGDFNGDGHVDLVYSEAVSNTLQLLWGNGLGGFTAGPALSVSTYPRTIANADLNGDGHVDLIVGRDAATFLGDGKVVVYHGNGTGLFTWVEEHNVWSNAVDLLLVDLNTDGVLDLVSANPSYGGPVGGLTVLSGNGQGGFVLSAQVLGVAESLAVADYDEDGKLDVAVTLAEDFVCAPEFRIYYGDGQGGFTGFVQYFVGCFTDYVTTADFNVDGHADLAVTDMQTDEIYVLEGDGTGGFAAPVAISILTDPRAPMVADFDGDGDADIALLARGSDSVAVLLNRSLPHFVRGDCSDDLAANIADAIFLLGSLFLSGTPVCLDACDASDDGSLDIADAVFLLSVLFANEPPVAPFPNCGVDTTVDGLGCSSPSSCP